MHRGRGENRSACNDRGARRAWMRPFSAWQESRDLGSRGKREIFNAGNLSRSESRNHLAAGKHSKILIIRRHDAEPAVVSRLDVIHFLATLQEIPRDSAETLGIQHISTKADVQGRAPAVLSSLQEKLHRNDTKGDFGLSYSCRISRWPAAVSHSLEWTGRGQKQPQNQAFAGRPSYLAASRIDGSNFPLQEAGMWDARTDQHQPNTGWWRRILFGGVAGIRVMSLKYPWLLLSELFSLPYFRRNGHQNSMDPVVETRRRWWRVPVKVATAISSRFCGSLSNPVVAAHFLLFIFELRNVIGSEFVEGDPRASQNPPLLNSILLEKCKSCGSKSSVYASDMESDYFFEACSMSLPDLDQEPQTGPSSDSLERWESTCSDVPSIPGDDHTLTADTSWAFHDSQNSFDMDQLAEIQSAEAAPQTLHSADTGLKCNEEMTRDVATCAPHHFADHPTCISLRERRHEYGDQNYLTPDELNTSRWRKMVFWHGHCRQGNPSLYILLGKAVQQLPAAELQIISSVIISQMEYAELNFFRGSAKQMNIIMDLWGIGLMRMPPLEILSRVGMIMNRDYAGRGGCIMLINAPVMLSLVIGAIKRVILRPGYNKGALIAKGFLEKKDQILFFNRNYEHALEKHFDLTLLPSMFGGKCNSTFCPEDCDQGVQFLERL